MQHKFGQSSTMFMLIQCGMRKAYGSMRIHICLLLEPTKYDIPFCVGTDDHQADDRTPIYQNIQLTFNGVRICARELALSRHK